MKPYLSIIIAGRNDPDDHTSLEAFKLSLQNLCQQIDPQSIEVEVILVEWNPPNEPGSLKKAFLASCFEGHFHRRAITVSREIHRNLPDSENFDIFYSAARNAGIRRAHGEYILCLSPGALLSDGLAHLLNFRALMSNKIYFCRNEDSSKNADNRDRHIRSWCENAKYKIKTLLRKHQARTFCNQVEQHLQRKVPASSIEKAYLTFIETTGHAPNIVELVSEVKGELTTLPSLLKNASDGDCSDAFLLMHRDRWSMTEGLRELNYEPKYLVALTIHRCLRADPSAQPFQLPKEITIRNTIQVRENSSRLRDVKLTENSYRQMAFDIHRTGLYGWNPPNCGLAQLSLPEEVSNLKSGPIARKFAFRAAADSFQMANATFIENTWPVPFNIKTGPALGFILLRWRRDHESKSDRHYAIRILGHLSSGQISVGCLFQNQDQSETMRFEKTFSSPERFFKYDLVLDSSEEKPIAILICNADLSKPASLEVFYSALETETIQ